MNIGYARTSKREQNLDLQLDALKLAGCERIFVDQDSALNEERPEWLKLVAQLREGDKVVIWKFDRVGRSVQHLIKVLSEIMAAGANFHCTTVNIDTSTSAGKLVYHMLAAISEFELDLIHERTNAGLRAARERGRIGGRPKGLSKDAETKSHAAASLYTAGILSVEEICGQLSIGKSTLYRYLRERGVKIGK